jgi:hypothetical protein
MRAAVTMTVTVTVTVAVTVTVTVAVVPEVADAVRERSTEPRGC